MSRKRVIVVGGGVIGAGCAYYLAKRNWEVTLVDRGRYGEGCSHANCGLVVCSSHILPLNEPGTVSKALRGLFSKHSAIHIRFGVGWRLWKWLYRFARHCRQDRMLTSAHACATLLASSASLFPELLRDEALECEWQQRGCLFVYRTQAEMERYAKTDRLLREQFGVAAKRYDGDAVTALEPALKLGLAGGWHYELDAHLRPDKLMSSWRTVLERLGVTIRERCEVQGFVISGQRARAVSTTKGEILAEGFVLAAGALTPQLNERLGCQIPIQPGKGYSITMPRPGQCPKIPIILQEHHVAVTPLQSGYRLGSTMEFAGYDKSLDERRVQVLKDAAVLYLHDPYYEPIEEQWYGWRPMTYDGKPIIGRAPALENVYLAAGHNMLGLTMAPATGKLLAELVNQERPHIDPQPFSPARFR